MNITKRDVQELKRRLTKKDCSISRISGCYVNENKEILVRFNQSFVDLAEEEFYKYLEIAKKTFSGTLGNNLLELSFDRTEAGTGCQQFLLTLKGSKLQQEALLDRFYEQVIGSYSCVGNYLILVFHDIYDVIAKAGDDAELDESEEIYEYMICAVCPVALSKPGLEYREEENRIAACTRDWVVGLPEIGFVYPAFSGRGSDVNAVMYYIKNGTNSHPEFVTDVLGCQVQRTAAEDRKLFQEIVQSAFGEAEDQAEDAFLRIQRNLDGIAAAQEDWDDSQPEELLTLDTVADVMSDVEMPDELRTQITRSYAEEFGEVLPTVGRLLDPKLAAEGAKRAHTLELERRIAHLQEQLAGQMALPERGDELAPWEDAVSDSMVVVRVPETKRGRIRTEVVDGQRCLVIPLDDDETAQVNGERIAD